ncbi:hypothetical protein [Nocardia concava]|uniref:hypothetical protein n=1 Tax=Nocardia concava TaxID=257281 RepID=UPI0012F9E995|nr:hypothetical protein [Nocardia concava]
MTPDPTPHSAPRATPRLAALLHGGPLALDLAGATLTLSGHDHLATAAKVLAIALRMLERRLTSTPRNEMQPPMERT